MQQTHRKAAARTALRARRRGITAGERERAALSLAELLEHLPAWQRSGQIALYLPNDGEIDPCAVAARARKAGKQLYLPVITDEGSLQFGRWGDEDHLTPNRYGILEPGPGSDKCDSNDLDTLLIPMVGWHRSGARLGMGGGFYDRALASARGPVRIGLAYECQELAELHTESWDVPMHYVATEKAVHHCLNRN